MKYIVAILAAFAVTFVGSSCATSIDEQHGRKLGKKKSKDPKTYFSVLNAAQRTTQCSDTSPGMGNAVLTYTEDSLCYKITFSGLSGVESISHIHGPAMVGKGAGVAFEFEFPSREPIKDGCFDLTDKDSDLVKEYLDDGLLYINIHTNDCKSGEIRGQIFET
jgi:hypothetical protein